MEEVIRQLLRREGAAVVGFADVGQAIDGDISHLPRAVSIGVNGNLRESNLELLRHLQRILSDLLRRRGYRFFCIPPDSDRITDTFISRLYPLFTHKIAATCAGLGWIGRNGLLISPSYGPRLALATVLTDAPLVADSPIESCLCSECNLCVEHCPSAAITGETWSRDNPFPDLVRIDRCSAYKDRTRLLNGKPNCGLCISICPYGRATTDFKTELSEDRR